MLLRIINRALWLQLLLQQVLLPTSSTDAFVIIQPSRSVATAAARAVRLGNDNNPNPHITLYMSSPDQQPPSAGEGEPAYDRYNQEAYEQQQQQAAYYDEQQQQQQQQQQPPPSEAAEEAVTPETAAAAATGGGGGALQAQPHHEGEQEEEDPERTALKEEIKQLEMTLKEKRRQVGYVHDQVEEYSQAGYARKVAEMENMRRARSMLNSSDKFASMASTLAEFLPVLDRLDALRAAYGDDEFGQQYNALPGSLRSAFTEMDVTEYTVQVGEVFDPARMVAVEQVYSNEFEPNTVIQPMSVGLELKGNAIRAVECMVSLGPEVVEEEAAGEAAAADMAPPEMEPPAEGGEQAN